MDLEAMIAKAPRFRVRRLSGALGGEVLDFDLKANGRRMYAGIERAFADLGVLVFRGQELEPEDLVEIARLFGDPSPYPFAEGLEGHPEITVIVKEPDQTSNFGGMWHSDTTYKAEPPSATMLYCRETPDAGGDTIFSCQNKAFEALSETLQGVLAGLKGVSSSDKNASVLRKEHLASGSMQGVDADSVMTVAHPAVRAHPVTKLSSLYVNPSHTTHFDGMTLEESEPLLSFLYQHQICPEFTARLRWEPGTLVIWDNCRTLHRAVNDYDGHRREMWRITLAGTAPVGPTG